MSHIKATKVRINEVLYQIVASYVQETVARNRAHKEGLRIIHHRVSGHHPWLVLKKMEGQTEERAHGEDYFYR